MDVPFTDSEPLDRLFEWVREQAREIEHGTVYLKIDIHEGKIISASKGAEKSERFPLRARK